MPTKLENFKKEKERTELPDIRTGNTIDVVQKINGKKQSFKGIVIARKHGKGLPGTITVRKIIDKVGVEKVFPLHSPSIEKIEVLKKGMTRKSKAYYIKEKTKKVARKKIKE